MAAHPSLGGCPFSARAFHLKFSLPPSRRDFLWVPDIPHPEWGMPLSITELEPHAYSDKDLPRWYFERPDVQPLLLHRTTSRHGCAAEDSIKPRKQRKTNDGLMELWKGEWHKMGRCFSILPPVSAPAGICPSRCTRTHVVPPRLSALRTSYTVLEPSSAFIHFRDGGIRSTLQGLPISALDIAALVLRLPPPRRPTWEVAHSSPWAGALPSNLSFFGRW